MARRADEVNTWGEGLSEALLDELPQSLVDAVIREYGKQAQRRSGKLPPELVAYLVVFMGLYRHLSIPCVLERLVATVGMPRSWKGGKTPCATAITQARDRLGWESLRKLFCRHAKHLTEEHAAVDQWRGHTTWLVDGTMLRAPDSDSNAACFTRPGGRNGAGGYPQLRCVAMVGIYTHLARAIAMGPYKRRNPRERVGEVALTRGRLVPQMKAGELCVFDRGFYQHDLLADLQRKGVEFVARVKTGKTQQKPKKLKKLRNGDWLFTLPVPISRRSKANCEALRNLRMITYQHKGFQPVTLLTSLTDLEAYPRKDLMELYHTRWEVELAFRELKTHMVGAPVTFRSKTPERVLQEAYGLLLAYNGVRSLMAKAAPANTQPRALSFKRCLEATRLAIDRAPDWSLAGELPRLLRVTPLASLKLPPRRSKRRYPRRTKTPLSPYPRNRSKAA